MKKTYITPEVMTVVLGTCQMMAESVPVVGDETINDGKDILTKEDVSSGGSKNVWDEEW